jgi:hypothetical protein
MATNKNSIKIIIWLVVSGSSDNFNISLSLQAKNSQLCFYVFVLTPFFFGVFRHYQYYFLVPPGVRLPKVGKNCSSSLEFRTADKVQKISEILTIFTVWCLAIFTEYVI